MFSAFYLSFYSKHKIIIQQNFLGQTAASRCDGFLTFQGLTLSPSSGCVGGLVEPKLMTRCSTLCCVYLHVVGRRMEWFPSG